MGISQLSMSLITCSPAVPVTSISHAFVSYIASPSHLRPRLQSPSLFPPSAASSTIEYSPGGITRRASILALLPFLVFPSPAVASPSDAGDDLQRYSDQTEGFTLLIPPSWVKVLSSCFHFACFFLIKAGYLIIWDEFG
jgi:hypothetical protein